MTRSPTSVAEVPRGLVELLYLRSAAGLDAAGGVPPVDGRSAGARVHGLTIERWTSLWAGELERLESGSLDQGAVRATVLAAGADLDDLRSWVGDVGSAFSMTMMIDVRDVMAIVDRETALLAGCRLGLVPLAGDYLHVGRHLVVASHRLRRQADRYLAELEARV